MTELPLSAQDEADLATLGAQDDGGMTMALLAVWSEVLGNIEAEREQPIPVVVASKVVASWPFLTFQETAQYHKMYHDILIDMRDILRKAIKDNPGCTDYIGDEDAAENHTIYRDVLVSWHLYLDQLESDWRAGDPLSHIKVATISDARAFFFAQTGLAGHLDVIGFTLANDEFLDAVTEAKGE